MDGTLAWWICHTHYVSLSISLPISLHVSIGPQRYLNTVERHWSLWDDRKPHSESLFVFVAHWLSTISLTFSIVKDIRIYVNNQFSLEMLSFHKCSWRSFFCVSAYAICLLNMHTSKKMFANHLAGLNVVTIPKFYLSEQMPMKMHDSQSQFWLLTSRWNRISDICSSVMYSVLSLTDYWKKKHRVGTWFYALIELWDVALLTKMEAEEYELAGVGFIYDKLYDWGPAFITKEKSVIFTGRSSYDILLNVIKH